MKARPDVAGYQLGAHTSMSASGWRHFLDGGKEISRAMEQEVERVLALAEAGDIFSPGAGAVTITEQHTERPRRVKRSHDFYLTETVKRVGQALDYCAEHATIGVITGGYGVGKTEALKRWREVEGRGWESLVFEFDDFAARNSVDFVESLADALDVPYKRGPHNGGKTFRAVCQKLCDSPCLLVLDQCEAVTPRVFQIIRQMWDRTRHAGVGVVLLAAPVLMERMQASRIQDLGALTSRVGIWATLRGLGRAEMVAIVRQEGISAEHISDEAFDLWWRACAGSMRRLRMSLDLVKSAHAGKRITEKTVAGVAQHLWGMSLNVREIAA